MYRYLYTYIDRVAIDMVNKGDCFIISCKDRIGVVSNIYYVEIGDKVFRMEPRTFNDREFDKNNRYHWYIEIVPFVGY